MPFSSAGGALLKPGIPIKIRFAYKGCANRPFYHIIIQNWTTDVQQQCVEQIGTYDPMPNIENQKLLGLNIERLEYWLGRGAEPTPNVAQLLGLAGLLPIHPLTLEDAWKNRRKIAEEKAKSAEVKEMQEPPTSSADVA